MQGKEVVQCVDGGSTQTASSLVAEFEEKNATPAILGDLQKGECACACSWSCLLLGAAEQVGTWNEALKCIEQRRHLAHTKGSSCL